MGLRAAEVIAVMKVVRTEDWGIDVWKSRIEGISVSIVRARSVSLWIDSPFCCNINGQVASQAYNCLLNIIHIRDVLDLQFLHYTFIILH